MVPLLRWGRLHHRSAWGPLARAFRVRTGRTQSLDSSRACVDRRSRHLRYLARAGCSVERVAALLHDHDLPLNRTDLDRLHIALDAGGPVRPLIEELYNLRPAVHAETVMPVDEPPPETSGTPVPAPRRLGPRALDQLRRMAVEDWGLRGEELEKFMRKAR